MPTQIIPQGEIDSIAGLTAALAGKASTSHNHNSSYTKIGEVQIFHGIESAGALSFDDTEHILTIASGTNTYWYQGTKYTTSSAITCDLDTYFESGLTDYTLYYFYFDDATGTLKASDSVWNLKTKVPVATVYWNGSAGALSKETHNHTRDLDWHINNHLTIGCRYYTGLAKTKPTTADDATLTISEGYLYDEDLAFHITEQTTSRIFYLADATHYTFADSSLPYAGTSGQPQWLDTDDYTLKDVGASDFVCMWVYGTGDVDRPIWIIPTHAATAYNTIASARLETPPNLAGFGLNPEIKLLHKFIYKGDGNFQESMDYRTVSSLPSGNPTAINAGSVLFTATGNISATNVQAALVELDNEKLNVGGGDGEGDLAYYADTLTDLDISEIVSGEDYGRFYAEMTAGDTLVLDDGVSNIYQDGKVRYITIKNTSDPAANINITLPDHLGDPSPAVVTAVANQQHIVIEFRYDTKLSRWFIVYSGIMVLEVA